MKDFCAFLHTFLRDFRWCWLRVVARVTSGGFLRSRTWHNMWRSSCRQRQANSCVVALTVVASLKMNNNGRVSFTLTGRQRLMVYEKPHVFVLLKSLPHTTNCKYLVLNFKLNQCYYFLRHLEWKFLNCDSNRPSRFFE